MIILSNNSPWGQRPPGNGGGNSGGGGGNQGPDLDAVMREAQDRFKKFSSKRPGQGGDFSPVKTVLVGVVLIIAIWLGTGFYRVEPEENAVILTFGGWTQTRGESGLGYHLPSPIQEAIKINVAFDRRIEIGFREQSTASQNVSAESMMLTGDENIIDINFVVLWRINDAKNYLFKIRDPEVTIKKVAESAMREIIGQTQIQKALTEARGDVEIKTKALIQKILDEYESGVTINSVQLLRVDPPAPVVDAFNDVQRARTDRERLKNEAETYRNDIVPKARGEAQKLIRDAEGYKEAVISKATGDAERFKSIYSAYAQSKDVTQTRIYIETMQDVFANSKKIIVGDKNAAPVLPYMNIDPIKGASK